MKDMNSKERWNLAAKLEGILGADLDADEEAALRDAIRIVSPEFAAMRDADEADAVDWFETTTPEEQKRKIVELGYPRNVFLFTHTAETVIHQRFATVFTNNGPDIARIIGVRLFSIQYKQIE